MDDDDTIASGDTLAASEPAQRDSDPVVAVGRFRIERELGRGAMGVVYAAFDPQLERRIALKLLRGRGDDTTARLVREARAMARLSHPNVITVHEVGELDGRAYIVMEIVEGTTLGEWMRDRGTEDEILDAFLAAGRGLAAAHDAGLVHRDFKPQNVLRGKTGRIVVTDFGLARTEEVTRVSQPAIAPGTVSTTGSTPLDVLTATGSVVGTPAYMAPEQWDGTINAASDQFAFCVALWEALAGERPFRGATVEELLAAIVQGTAALDVARIPPRLRAPLKRGLNAEPANRWPSMNALLSALAPAPRRRWIPLAIGSAGAIAIATIAIVMVTRPEAGPSCPAPLVDPSAYWPPAHAPELARSLGPSQIAAISDGAARWRASRQRVCRAPDAPARLACLDAVIARNDAVLRGLRGLDNLRRIELGYALLDPAVCELPKVPRLVASQTPEMRAAIAAQVAGLRAVSFVGAPMAPREVTIPDEPCAAAIAALTRVFQQRDAMTWVTTLADARSRAERCGDDRTLADVALVETRVAFGMQPGNVAASEALRRAEIAVDRVAQPGLVATLHYYRAVAALAEARPDDAKRELDKSRTLYQQAHHLRGEGFAVLEQIRMFTSGDAPEVDRVRPIVDEFRARASKLLDPDDPILMFVDGHRALWQMFHDGDITGGAAALDALNARRKDELRDPIVVRATVRDARGAPVAGAHVAAGVSLSGATHDIALATPFFSSKVYRGVTNAAGELTLTLERGATIVASAGDQRSPAMIATESTELVLAPTRRLEGTVDLGELPPAVVNLDVREMTQAVPTYTLVAPVLRDGTFAVDGVGRHSVEVHATYETFEFIEDAFVQVDATASVLPRLTLDLANEPRELFVIVRSTVATPLDGAQVVVTPSTNQPKTALDVFALPRSTSVAARDLPLGVLPSDVTAKRHDGDLVARFTRVPRKAATICSYAAQRAAVVPHALTQASGARFEVRCTPLGNERIIVLDVPPAPRPEDPKTD